ncbi:ABC transporter permease [Streptomyces radicis]|uniref:ABC transporter permease n=1 Tax=Streptomyces radicis TaxID=1750517 RepID=A0A3A9W5Y7_9ACTN|nr:ABC transporter permease [Streptomyces radicis]RKN08621.1 ABC transporter permease [Streptomyces radicis]RKN21779.1 ABC transporter permease [Streptomyces radicis]
MPSPPSASRATAIVVLAVPAIVAFALWAFAWPAARTGPNDLPVGVAGQGVAAEQVAERLEAREGAFDVRRYEGADEAAEAVRDREVYGAFVVGGDGGPEVLTASAGGPAVAQLLTELASAQAPEGAPVAVTDVVPAPEGDPRGAAFNASVLPMALAGMATGVLVTRLRLGRVPALLAMVGASVTVGTVAAAIGHGWLDVLGGSWVAVTAGLALIVLAGAGLVAGSAKLLGPGGIAVGALILILLGNPWSGAGSAPEMLPDPIPVIGPWLPTGAGATLLRSVAFFDGAGAAFPAAVLGGWAVLGTTALLLARRRAPARPAPPEDARVPATV